MSVLTELSIFNNLQNNGVFPTKKLLLDFDNLEKIHVIVVYKQ